MTALIILGITGIVLLYLSLFRKYTWIIPLGTASLIFSIIFQISEWNQNLSWFNQMIVFDNISILFNISIFFFTALIFILGYEYYKGVEKDTSENYALFIFSVCGAILLTSYHNLILLFLGLEILSIPLYILSGGKKHSLRSNEASFKYFLLGSFSGAFLLFGIALIYGVTASFSMETIQMYMQSHNGNLPMMLKTGMLLLLLGLSFKIAASPFHFWLPDVYEGSPTLVTVFMATIVKTAAFASIFRIFDHVFFPLPDSVRIIILIMAVFSMVIGNVTMLWQLNLKRIIAYSSIGNTGFIMVFLLASDQQSGQLMLLYLVTYMAAIIPLFFVFYKLKISRGNHEFIEILQNLHKNYPFLFVIFTLALFSMAGIPILGGFWAKYYAISFSIKHQMVFFAIIMILASLVSLYYYLKLVNTSFRKSTDPYPFTRLPLLNSTSVVLVTCVLILIFFTPLFLAFVHI